MVEAEEIVARYSRRAEELRTIAESVRDPEYSRALRDWASTDDHMVQRAVEVMSSYDGLQQEKRSVPGGREYFKLTHGWIAEAKPAVAA